MATTPGNTTNFSGKGAPNPKLVIPNLGQQPPELQAIFLAIVNWCNALVAPSTGAAAFYASLTGAGETATPGDLTQQGGFTVNDNKSAAGIVLQDTGTSSSPGITVEATGNGNINITASGGDIIEKALSANIELYALDASVVATNIQLETPVGGILSLQVSNASPLAFYGFVGAAQQTVTGSRGGNAALASLLNALAATGLIVNSTTA